MYLTDKHIELFKSTLGLKHGKTPYRNYFNIWKYHEKGNANFELWMNLVNQGYAIFDKDIHEKYDSYYFHLNENGMEIIMQHPTHFKLTKELLVLSAKEIMIKCEL